MIYQAYQAHADMMSPLRAFVAAAIPVLNDRRFAPKAWMPVRKLAAAWEVFALARLTHRLGGPLAAPSRKVLSRLRCLY